MASALSFTPGPLGFSRRVVEWGLVLVVILVLLVAFLRQQRFVQGQAELAAIKTTVGALRSAFVLNQLQQQLGNRSASVAASQRNPFLILQQTPLGYRGEVRRAEAAFAEPGSWMYDPDCSCIGYLPIVPQWLASPGGASSIWYRVEADAAVKQLVAMDDYTWQGENLQ